MHDAPVDEQRHVEVRVRRARASTRAQLLLGGEGHVRGAQGGIQRLLVRVPRQPPQAVARRRRHAVGAHAAPRVGEELRSRARERACGRVWTRGRGRAGARMRA